MKKAEYIDRLRRFALNEGRGLRDEYGHPNYATARGEALLARMFADWLVRNAPEESIGLNWARDIPRMLVAAHSEFSVDKRWKAERAEYLADTSYPIPDLVDAYAGGVHRQLVAHSAARLHPLLAEAPWLRSQIVATTEAQREVIKHSWGRFVQKAYRQLIKRIRAERHRGNAGTFGGTQLLTYSMAGRVMFSFRPSSGADHVITFVADESDDYGYRSGPNFPGAPYAVCVAMIDEVVANWDPDKLVADHKVGLGL